MAAFTLNLLPWGLLPFLGLLVALRYRGHSWVWLGFFALFGLYVLIALQMTLFPIYLGRAYAEMMQRLPFMERVNFMPLFLLPYVWVYRGIVRGFFYNILLTIPVGFGLNFLTQVNIRTFLGVTLVVGLGIEATQLGISLLLGYPYRVIDINDVLGNTLGVVVGYGAFRLISALYLFLARRFLSEPSGLWAYLYAVAKQTPLP